MTAFRAKIVAPNARPTATASSSRPNFLPRILLVLAASSSATLISVFAFHAPAGTNRATSGGSRIGSGGRALHSGVSMNSGGEALDIGGPKMQSAFTGTVAGLSMFSMYGLSEVLKSQAGLPMYGPPLAAVTLIFAAEATNAVKAGTAMKVPDIVKRAIPTGVSMLGGCTLAVVISRMFGATPLARALAISASSLFMSFFPRAAFFPPVAAFCSLYIDNAIVAGPLAALGYRFAFFPCVTGTMFLLFATRAFASLLAQPLSSAVASQKELGFVQEEVEEEVVDMWHGHHESDGPNVYFTRDFTDFLQQNPSFYDQLGRPSLTDKLSRPAMDTMSFHMGNTIDDLVRTNILISTDTFSAGFLDEEIPEPVFHGVAEPTASSSSAAASASQGINTVPAWDSARQKNFGIVDTHIGLFRDIWKAVRFAASLGPEKRVGRQPANGSVVPLRHSLVGHFPVGHCKETLRGTEAFHKVKNTMHMQARAHVGAVSVFN